MKLQKGFTLIELVMVIVILGILAAVAIPKFIDLTGNAQTAAVAGIVGALGAAGADNYAACAVVGNAVTANVCVRVAKCSDVATLLSPPMAFGAAGAGISGTYNVAVDTAVAAPDGTTGNCTLQIIKNGNLYSGTYVVTAAGQ